MKFILNQFTVTRGQDEQLLIALLDDQGYPVNISGAVTVKLEVIMADGSTLQKDPSQGWVFGVCDQVWMYLYSFSAAETLLLAKLAKQSVQIKITYGDGKIHFIPIKSCLTAIDPII